MSEGHLSGSFAHPTNHQRTSDDLIIDIRTLHNSASLPWSVVFQEKLFTPTLLLALERPGTSQLEMNPILHVELFFDFHWLPHWTRSFLMINRVHICSFEPKAAAVSGS